MIGNRGKQGTSIPKGLYVGLARGKNIPLAERAGGLFWGLSVITEILMRWSIMAFSPSFNALCGVLYESSHELFAWHGSNFGS